jgi:hypothetical protein
MRCGGSLDVALDRRDLERAFDRHSNRYDNDDRHRDRAGARQKRAAGSPDGLRFHRNERGEYRQNVRVVPRAGERQNGFAMVLRGQPGLQRRKLIRTQAPPDLFQPPAGHLRDGARSDVGGFGRAHRDLHALRQ